MKDLDSALEQFESALGEIPDNGMGRYAKMQSLFCLYALLQRIVRAPEEDPYPRLVETLRHQSGFLGDVSGLGDFFDEREGDASKAGEDAVEKLTTLYENAWTVYSKDTYEHSVKLIVDRLLANGFDAAYFSGKRCFDGGCGTARFAAAMAQLGASEVVAADIGSESLKFAEEMLQELGISGVELVECDITDLTRWSDGYFDFVVSNGVLHHTVEQHRGLREHFRVTKKGGDFWLYLYGAGALFWRVFDLFKPALSGLSSPEIRAMLTEFGVREGGIYSFLDMLAPIRTYYRVSEVKEILAGSGEFEVTMMKGTTLFDDMERFLACRFGKDIFGPDGEIRLIIKPH